MQSAEVLQPVSVLMADPITLLKSDVRDASRLLSYREARFLVDLYYQVQELRKTCKNQVRSMISETGEDDEPTKLLRWFGNAHERTEGEIRYCLKKFAESRHMGEWAMGVTGIGPIIAAGLMAHINIEKAPTAGNIWRFAGLDPTIEWKIGKKRPFNAKLKTLCWKIGESFVKTMNRPTGFYGRLYQERKDLESKRNEAGEFEAQAKAKLKKFRILKTTEAYKSYSNGRLPKGHIHSRAKRYAVKIFLSHWHAEAYRDHFGEEPPKPFAISQLGHAHMIDPPPQP